MWEVLETMELQISKVAGFERMLPQNFEAS